MKYRLVPNEFKELKDKVLQDAKSNPDVGVIENKEWNELKKEIETWLTYGYKKPRYKYSARIEGIIQEFLKKYSKEYQKYVNQFDILKKEYEDEEDEDKLEGLEMTQLKVSKEQIKFLNEILVELEKEVKEVNANKG